MADDLDTPLRLADAVPLACPGASVAALRRERDKGHLTTFILAGKEFTTRRHIQEMHKLCRVVPKPQPVFPPRKPPELPPVSADIALQACLRTAERLTADISKREAAARAERKAENARFRQQVAERRMKEK